MNAVAAWLSVAIAAHGFASLASTARAAEADHPLVSPYAGSTLRKSSVVEFGEYRAFTGMDATGKEPTGIALEGRITKLLYSKPGERSVLEVFRNYELAMQDAGAEILYSCNQDELECAERYAGPTLQQYSGIMSVANLNGRYLLARLTNADAAAYIAIAVGQNFTDVHVVELKDMETGMASLDADALGRGLDARGYVIVEGIFFDTDEATIKPESDPAIAEVARLLDARPALDVFVVGHTDMQGDFQHNMGLSNRRAAAVANVLVERHGIARERLDVRGVGPLAPQASNAHAAGKTLNRRVVLVARF